MARLPRIVAPGLPHHVTQRGNRRCDVFLSPCDHEGYLRLLAHYAMRHGLRIWAYCLMTNHVHLIVVPDRAESMGRALRDAHQAYAAYMNERLGVTGHLWQGRYFSCILDEAHLWAAIRYVENNPVHAGMTGTAEAYPWSSAAAHCGLKTDPILSSGFPPVGAVADWRALLASDDAVQRDQIQRNTRTGRPCGSEDFLIALGKRLALNLVPRKAGCKPKAMDTVPQSA
jgi:putative transposase